MLMSRWGLTGSRIGLALVGISVALAATACGSSAVGAAPIEPDGPLVQQASEVSDARMKASPGATEDRRGPGAPARFGTTRRRYVVGVPPRRLQGQHSDVSGHGRPARAAARVIAQTSTGDPGSIVMIGAHLDSVEDGPGIVDDGSGVAALLEIATQLSSNPALQNTVRFAFFGGEENGAEGSNGYVRGLSNEDRKKIKLYLNVDMVASKNGGYFVQGGKGSDKDESGPAGSGTIARVLADQLVKTGVTKPEIIEFVGDDESAFIDAGIPVGGAENGDAERKTTGQAKAWGGQARERYDPCYHQACDRVDNVNRDVLNHYMRALAGTLAYFATSKAELG